MAKFMTPKTYNKLRAGNSAWRCLIWFRQDAFSREPYVKIQHVVLTGARHLHHFRSGGRPCYSKGSLKVGNDFLSDVGHCSFATYRQACRYRDEVARGMRADDVHERRKDLLEFSHWGV